MVSVVSFIFWVADKLIYLYMIGIVIWSLLSWFPGGYQSRFGAFIDRLISPYIRLFNFIPPIGGISFSPVIAILVLSFAQTGVHYLATMVMPMIQ